MSEKVLEGKSGSNDRGYDGEGSGGLFNNADCRAGTTVSP